MCLTKNPEKTDPITSFHKLKEIIGVRSFDRSTVKDSVSSFSMLQDVDRQYVEPNFSLIEGALNAPKTKPQVILISAAGATGKTALAKQLSAVTNSPVFDLAENQPVASHSLTGLFTKVFGKTGFSAFTSCLANGTACLIIDALDEGRVKTTEQGFNSFLDDIAEYAYTSNVTSFVILGRTLVLEHTWLYLHDKGIDAILLKIEPFTIRQAEEFIDKQVGETRFDTQFKLVKDYIIKSVEGFFTKISSIKDPQFQNFIGYAPVLLSISTLLIKEKNYLEVLNKLRQSDNKGIDLIITIMEYILQREKTKVEKQVLPILGDQNEELRKKIVQQAYSIEEQCIRLLSRILNKDVNLSICNEPALNAAYEDKMSTWIEEHPFLQNGAIQNSVFECYLISKLFTLMTYNGLLDMYMKDRYKDAFMLIFLYEKIAVEKKVQMRHVPYLYASLKSLDDKFYSSWMSLEADDEEAVFFSDVDIEFSIYENVKGTVPHTISFSSELKVGESLVFFGNISNAIITCPKNTITFIDQKIQFKAPVLIVCDQININCREVILEGGKNSDDGILLEANKVTIDYSENKIPVITNYLEEGNKGFGVSSPGRLPYPLSDYYIESKQVIEDPDIDEKYMRFRRIALSFRSHSKGALARFKDKITHRRILKNEVGNKVLNSLLKSGILEDRGTMYFWNAENANKYLGINWIELRQRKINAKLLAYLKNIQ